MEAEGRTSHWREKRKSLTLPSQALIDGRHVDAAAGKTFECINPADGEVLGHVASCDVADIDKAVESARRAFNRGVWADMGVAERKKILFRFADLIEANREELALLESLNVGKPVVRSYNGDIPSAVACIRWYAEALDKYYGEVIDPMPGLSAMVTREPLGVVGAVVPWNFPLSMAAWKIAPALAVGNSVILKPAEQSPYTALRIGALALEAGIPEGVLNVVPGYGETAGRALGLHMDVDCITFTGSTEVGGYFMQYAGTSNVKRVSLELGGKSPQIVLRDCADLDVAAQAVAAGIFSNQGEVCNAGSRLVVEARVKDELLEKIVAAARQIALGDPLDENTQMGPLVTREHMERVTGYIEQGRKEGAKVLVGGERALPESGGNYVQPTVFDAPSNALVIAQEEIFGPVLTVLTVNDFDEAIRVANDTKYGLAAGVWTSDIKKAHTAAKRIQAGVVGVNCFDKGAFSVPFGGFKRSGFGRDKSMHALDKYTDLKAAWFAV